MSDLFGHPEPKPPALTQSGKVKRKPTAANGYAWKPGTGPEGETCRTCSHLYRNRLAKTYLKCELVRAKWTGGPGTDIKARSPACKFWEKKDG